jgi:hypothetical protein
MGSTPRNRANYAKLEAMKTETETLSGKEAAARFSAAMAKILSVSHAELIRREAEYKKKAALNPRKRGPKPKSKPSAS